jgi:hypothetical protein
MHVFSQQILISTMCKESSFLHIVNATISDVSISQNWDFGISFLFFLLGCLFTDPSLCWEH